MSANTTRDGESDGSEETRVMRFTYSEICGIRFVARCCVALNLVFISFLGKRQKKVFGIGCLWSCLSCIVYCISVVELEVKASMEWFFFRGVVSVFCRPCSILMHSEL